MNKDNKLQLLSPLFLKYQADFEKNPRSRVFAPLAESYRKLGMTDKAMEILSQGIRFHPSYVMGYLGLAFCYFDLKQFNLTYSTLRPLTESNRDNLRLQKLFSDVCLELGKQEEALETLKYLLFINPRDKEVAELVARLEHAIEDRYKPQHKPIIIPERDLTSESQDHEEKPNLFDLEKLDQIQKIKTNDFDDWMAIDLSLDSKRENKNTTQIKSEMQSSLVNFDHWNLEKSSQIELDSPVEKVDSQKQITLDLNSKNDDGAPLVTHTLVDLYCGQGHIEKALEVLEKILLLNPNDQKTIKKIKEIQALAQPLEQYDVEEKAPETSYEHIEESEISNFASHFSSSEVSEEDGRRHLMSLIDEKLGPLDFEQDMSRVEGARILSEKLSLFLKKIQKRALDYQGRV